MKEREKRGEKKKSTTWQFSETSTIPLTHPNFEDMVEIIHFLLVKGRRAAVRCAVCVFVRARREVKRRKKAKDGAVGGEKRSFKEKHERALLVRP